MERYYTLHATSTQHIGEADTGICSSWDLNKPESFRALKGSLHHNWHLQAESCQFPSDVAAYEALSLE
jgi:hypothetical protein